MFDFYSFIDFTGDETEKEFLGKCLEQWDMTIEKNTSDTNKLLEIGTLFSEIRHRVDDLGGD